MKMYILKIENVDTGAIEQNYFFSQEDLGEYLFERLWDDYGQYLMGQEQRKIRTTFERDIIRPIHSDPHILH